MGSTTDGMVWFDGKRISPNDARELGKALDFLALRAFSGKSQSLEIVVLVERHSSLQQNMKEKRE